LAQHIPTLENSAVVAFLCMVVALYQAAQPEQLSRSFAACGVVDSVCADFFANFFAPKTSIALTRVFAPLIQRLGRDWAAAYHGFQLSSRGMK
jgi:hypothetical protein